MFRNSKNRSYQALLVLLAVLSGPMISQAHALQGPQITTPSTINGVVGQLLSVPITATGSPTPVVVALDLPLGLSLSLGVLGGTPATAGQKTITILATNLLGTDLKTVTLNITNPLGTAPAITSALSANGTLGQALNYVITSSGTAPVVYVAQNLPSGLLQVGDTISGTPLTAGEYDVQLNATNAAGADNKTLHISVAAPNTPAHLTSLLTAGGTVGVPFEQLLTGTGSGTLNFVVSQLPAGLTQVGNTIVGTPTVDGVYDVLISVTNLVNTELNHLLLTIDTKVKPTITSGLSVNLAANAALNYTITAIGTQPISYGVANLPAGLQLQGAVISGTPTVSGTYNITLAASNSAGQDLKTLVVVIAAANDGGNGGGGGGTNNPPIGGDVLDTDGDGIPNDTDFDDDNDGFPDGIEEAAGSNPLDPNSTPMGGSAATQQDLVIRKMSIKLNFAHSQKDALQVQGTLPVPPNFTLNTQKVVVDVGGVSQLFTLTSKGVAKTATSQFQLKVKKARKGAIVTQNAAYTLRMKSGDWQVKLAKYGLTNADAKKQQHMVPVAIWFNSTIFLKNQIQFYTAKAKKSGATK